MLAADVQGITKTYGGTTAVDQATLTVSAGEFAAIIGPNGAGKTTLVEIIEGQRRPDAGHVRVLGLNPHDHHQFAQLRHRIGVVLQRNSFEPELRLIDALRRQASYYSDRYSIDSLVEALDLGSYLGKPMGKLSEGTARRADLAVALIGRPGLLVLDEPTAGLDPISRRSVHALLAELLAGGTSVIMISHHLDEIERLASRVHLMVGGRIRMAGSPLELVQRSRIEAVVEFDLPRASLDSLPDGAITTGTRVRYTTSTPDELMQQLDAWAGLNGDRLSNLSVTRPSLDDVYSTLVDMEGAQS